MQVQTVGSTKVHDRIAIYGDPKKGKTRLATSLPWGPVWGDKAVYVAWDDGADTLASVLHENREHLLVVTPTAKTDARGRQVFDPLEEAAAIASADWVKEGCSTIIWDTMTATARDILGAAAVAGKYGNNIAMGTPGKPDYVPQPTQGDYGAAQRCTNHIIDLLFNQPLNVIVLFHGIDDDNDGKSDMVGGPATVGKAAIEPTAARFDNLFRLTSERVRVGTAVPPVYTTRRVVLTEPKGYWMAGIRCGLDKNPIPEYILSERPVDFWNEYLKTQEPK